MGHAFNPLTYLVGAWHRVVADLSPSHGPQGPYVGTTYPKELNFAFEGYMNFTWVLGEGYFSQTVKLRIGQGSFTNFVVQSMNWWIGGKACRAQDDPFYEYNDGKILVCNAPGGRLSSQVAITSAPGSSSNFHSFYVFPM